MKIDKMYVRDLWVMELRALLSVRGGSMHKLIGLMLLVLATSTVAMGFQVGPTAVHKAPEIATMGMAALTLLAGAAMILRGRRRE
jgi:hypothetical protein